MTKCKPKCQNGSKTRSRMPQTINALANIGLNGNLETQELHCIQKQHSNYCLGHMYCIKKFRCFWPHTKKLETIAIKKHPSQLCNYHRLFPQYSMDYFTPNYFRTNQNWSSPMMTNYFPTI